MSADLRVILDRMISGSPRLRTLLELRMRTRTTVSASAAPPTRAVTAQQRERTSEGDPPPRVVAGGW